MGKPKHWERTTYGSWWTADDLGKFGDGDFIPMWRARRLPASWWRLKVWDFRRWRAKRRGRKQAVARFYAEGLPPTKESR